MATITNCKIPVWVDATDEKIEVLLLSSGGALKQEEGSGTATEGKRSMISSPGWHL